MPLGCSNVTLGMHLCRAGYQAWQPWASPLSSLCRSSGATKVSCGFLGLVCVNRAQYFHNIGKHGQDNSVLKWIQGELKNTPERVVMDVPLLIREGIFSRVSPEYESTMYFQ